MHRAYQLSSSELAKSASLTLSQLLTFHSIASRCTDRTLPVIDTLATLGRIAGLEQSTVSRQIDALAEQGLIKKLGAGRNSSLALPGLKRPICPIPHALLWLAQDKWLEIGCYLWLLGSGQLSLNLTTVLPIEKISELNYRVSRSSLVSAVCYLIDKEALTGDLTRVRPASPNKALEYLADLACITYQESPIDNTCLFGAEAALC